MKDISVIIVNHNTKKLCMQAIEYVFSSALTLDVEIIIVDNSSRPEEKICAFDDKVIVLPHVENKGFGNACNIGANHASADILLFLNSDTILENDLLFKAYSYFRSCSGIGAMGIRTVLENGAFDHGCKRGFPTPARALFYFTKLDRLFPKNKFFGGYRMTYLPENETNEVDVLSGAFLMISKRLFFEVKGFDEDYFMYGEDVDLCYRIKEKGYKLVYYAGATLIHLKGQSGLHAKNANTINHFYGSMSLFYDKHYKNKYPFILTFFVKAAIAMKRRLAVRGVRNG